MNLLHEKIKGSKICLSYLGTFDDEITDKLIGVSESYLEKTADLGKIKNKVSFLIAECFQNIVRHGAHSDQVKTEVIDSADFFQINVTNDRVALTSGNIIEDAAVGSLEKKLLQVNSLNADELKKLYNEVLQSETFSDKGGAGLGLIEMARKSGLPIKYIFDHVNDTFSRFFLSLEITNKKDIQEREIEINDIKQFYELLYKEHVMILYKGDFSKDIVTPIIEMLQKNFSDNPGLLGKEKRIAITLIETIQNVSKHGNSLNDIKEGIFTISKQNEHFILEIGNYVNEHNYNVLNEQLSLIKNMGLTDITRLYKKRLLEPELTPEGNCGLGLLEIARNSNNNFSYEFVRNEQNEFFYSLKITI